MKLMEILIRVYATCKYFYRCTLLSPPYSFLPSAAIAINIYPKYTTDPTKLRKNGE